MSEIIAFDFSCRSLRSLFGVSSGRQFDPRSCTWVASTESDPGRLAHGRAALAGRGRRFKADLPSSAALVGRREINALYGLTMDLQVMKPRGCAKSQR